MASLKYKKKPRSFLRGLYRSVFIDLVDVGHNTIDIIIVS